MEGGGFSFLHIRRAQLIPSQLNSSLLSQNVALPSKAGPLNWMLVHPGQRQAQLCQGARTLSLSLCGKSLHMAAAADADCCCRQMSPAFKLQAEQRHADIQPILCLAKVCCSGICIYLCLDLQPRQTPQSQYLEHNIGTLPGNTAFALALHTAALQGNLAAMCRWQNMTDKGIGMQLSSSICQNSS